MDYILYFMGLLLSVSTFTASYYAIKFGMIIIKLQDDIEESLDELDVAFNTMNEILKKPIFFDSSEVRQCINEIKRCRDTIIKIANRLTSLGQDHIYQLDEKELDQNENESKKEDS
jgi:hypothetical protein